MSRRSISPNSLPVVGRLHQPAYTGENRCTPCTVLNVLIAAAIGLAAGVLLGGFAGASVFVGGLGLIYLRGYLVPGTPTLTKRYAPKWLHRLKPSDQRRGDPSSADTSDDQRPAEPDDPESVLFAAGAIRECPHEDDVCLDERFSGKWDELMITVRERGIEDRAVADFYNVRRENVTITRYGDAFEARVDGRLVGQWESRAGLIADVAAAKVLDSSSAAWNSLDAAARGRVLYSLRAFLDTCPSCDGDLSTQSDTVESCCWSKQVVAMECLKCGSRVFEVDAADIE